MRCMCFHRGEACEYDDSASPGVLLTGRVADSAGAPHEGIAVILCVGGDCRSSITTASGALAFPDVPPNSWVVQNINYPEPVGVAKHSLLEYSSFYDLITTEEGDIDLGTLVPPPISEWTATEELMDGGATTYFAGSEDELTLSWDTTLAFPPAAVDIPGDELTLGAGVIPPSRWPRGLGGKTALAAYGFAPWETGLEPEGASFSFSWTLPPGSDPSLTYGFLVADYAVDIHEGRFSYVAAVLDAAAGTISAEFHHLSMLIPVHD